MMGLGITLQYLLDIVESEIYAIARSEEHGDNIIQGYLHLAENFYNKITSEKAIIYDVMVENHSHEEDSKKGFYTISLIFKCAATFNAETQRFEVKYYPVTKPASIITTFDDLSGNEKQKTITMQELWDKKILPEFTNIESPETQSLFAITDIYDKICEALDEKIASLSTEDLGTICEILDLRLTVAKYEL